MRDKELEKLEQSINRVRTEFESAQQSLVRSVGGNKENAIARLNEAMKCNIKMAERESDPELKARYLVRHKRLEWALRQMYQS